MCGILYSPLSSFAVNIASVAGTFIAEFHAMFAMNIISVSIG